MTDEVIDRLAPLSELHNKVKRHLLDRLEFSERKMSQFYSRWNAREKQVQAYINLQQYEKMLKTMNETGEAPVAVSLTIPYTYATISTISTYMTHTFTGRKPMLQVGANSAEAVNPGQNLETLLQWNIDSRQMPRHWMQFFKDGEIYGVAAMKCLWEVTKAKRTVKKQTLMGDEVSVREMRTVFEGNDLENIDVFLFFPDPRVPMAEVAWRGEYVFWRSFDSRHKLLAGKADGKYSWVDSIGMMPAENLKSSGGDSVRSLRSSGDSQPGVNTNQQNGLGLEFVQLDQGTVEIIPSQLFEDDTLSSRPEKWIFTLANKHQIIQAEPFEYDHDWHPVVVSEPETLGYGFGHLSTADFLSPIQDAASWFLNSHMHNVRSVLNNMLVVNPAMIEMKDLASPKPGKLIRLKRSAMGQDPRNAVMQLQFYDVTRGNMQDLEGLFRMGDMLSSVNDNLRGIQDAGGRKTATEVRTSGEAGASRLAAKAKLLSAQAFSPLASMMSVNLQQFMTRSYQMLVAGRGETVDIGPDSIVGDFYFPIHDGTLPLDKIAMLDIWKEILLGVVNPQELQATFDGGKIFEHVAELGGAKNIASYRRQQMPGMPGMMPPVMAPEVGAPGEDLAANLDLGVIPFPAPRRAL